MSALTSVQAAGEGQCICHRETAHPYCPEHGEYPADRCAVIGCDHPNEGHEEGGRPVCKCCGGRLVIGIISAADFYARGAGHE